MRSDENVCIFATARGLLLWSAMRWVALGLLLVLLESHVARAQGAGAPTPNYCGNEPRNPPWTAIELLAGVPQVTQSIVWSGRNDGTDSLAITAVQLTVQAADSSSVLGTLDVWGLLGVERGEMLVAFRPALPFAAGESYRAHVTIDNAQLTSCPTRPPLEADFDIAIASEPLPDMPEPPLVGVDWRKAWKDISELCCPLSDPAPCGGGATSCDMCWQWMRLAALRPRYDEPQPTAPDLLHAVRFQYEKDGQLLPSGVFGLRRQPWVEESSFVPGPTGKACVVAELLRFRDRARSSRTICVPDIETDPNTPVTIEEQPVAMRDVPGTVATLAGCASPPPLNPWADFTGRSDLRVWATFRDTTQRTSAAAAAKSAATGAAGASSIGTAGTFARSFDDKPAAKPAAGGCTTARRGGYPTHAKPAWVFAFLLACFARARAFKRRSSGAR